MSEPLDPVAVAKHVMGWPEICGNTPFSNVVDRGGWIVDRGGWQMPEIYLGGGVLNHERFDPEHDANHDYAVLVKVRETWLARDIHLFERELMECQERRAATHDPEMQGFWYDYSILLYEPGDYSRAALAVLNKKGR